MLLPTITTQRLTIRQFAPTDWSAVYTYTADPRVMEYLPEGVFTPEQAQAFAQRNASEEATDYAVLLSDSGQLIGHLVFHPWFAHQTFEIGWIFAPAYHGKGYASEAAWSLLRYGFETMRLHRIIATCQPENPASYGMMEKIGMRREGVFEKGIYRGEGVWWSEYFYALLAEEWFAVPRHPPTSSFS